MVSGWPSGFTLPVRVSSTWKKSSCRPVTIYWHSLVYLPVDQLHPMAPPWTSPTPDHVTPAAWLWPPAPLEFKNFFCINYSFPVQIPGVMSCSCLDPDWFRNPVTELLLCTRLHVDKVPALNAPTVPVMNKSGVRLGRETCFRMKVMAWGQHVYKDVTMQPKLKTNRKWPDKQAGGRVSQQRSLTGVLDQCKNWRAGPRPTTWEAHSRGAGIRRRDRSGGRVSGSNHRRPRLRF